MDDIVERFEELLEGPVPMNVSRQDIRDALEEIRTLRAFVRELNDKLADFGDYENE